VLYLWFAKSRKERPPTQQPPNAEAAAQTS